MSQTGRNRLLHFKEQPDDNSLSHFEELLGENESEVKVTVGGYEIKIAYKFPQLTFSAIRTCLVTSELHNKLTMMSALSCRFISYCEENELFLSQHFSDWQSCLEDLHVHYFDKRRETLDKSHKHLWRRFQKNK